MSAANFLLKNLWSSFFKKMYSSLDIGKVKKIYGYCIHTPICESRSVIFKHFRVLLAVRVFNIYLKNSFYIDINKNIISYFNTRKLLFVILLLIWFIIFFHPLFLIHFGKRFEEKLWLGVGLVRCDR